MATLYKYQYKCTTENATITEWREEDDGLPTQCKNDAAHSIISASIRIAPDGIRKPNLQEIKEESVPTGGNFQARTLNIIDAPANSTTIVNKSWPIPIGVLAVYFVTTADHEGDELEVDISPDTLVGTITSNVTAGDTVLNVSSTVIENIKLGYYVQLSTTPVAENLGSSTTDNLGEVIAIDKDASTITVDIPATNSFTAPAYIYMTVKMVTDYMIGPPWEYVIGESKIGASHLPANTTVRLHYKNNSPSATKTIIFKFERLY